MPPLRQQVSQVIQPLTQADQVYICLSSHGGWKPAHRRPIAPALWLRSLDILTKPVTSCLPGQ